jgi:hypothetical protein
MGSQSWLRTAKKIAKEDSTSPSIGSRPASSGNPGGRPKKKPITQLYERILENPESLAAIKKSVLNVKLSLADVIAVRAKEQRQAGLCGTGARAVDVIVLDSAGVR